MEQREACKSFEKVLVQNIQFGLSPSLTEAIRSISRWKLVQSALPHVMHCCSALLYNRKNCKQDKLGASETKLLYTLHWIMLDAGEECADAELEAGVQRSPDHYLLPITTIEIFIFLFTPLISYLKNSDFLTSFRLENGYKVWDPLFLHQHPDIPSFTSKVKPIQSLLRPNHYERRSTKKFDGVFIGSDQTNKQSTIPSTTGPTNITAGVTSNSDASIIVGKDGISSKEEFITANGVTEKSLMDKTIDKTQDSKSSSLNEKQKELELGDKLNDPSMATYLDVAVLRCLFASQWLEEGIHWALCYLTKRQVKKLIFHHSFSLY